MQPQAASQMGPADLARLFACLREAMSTNAGVRSRAEAVLQLLEEQPGYCSCLAVGTAPLCLDTCFTLATRYCAGWKERLVCNLCSTAAGDNVQQTGGP